ncbi:hypothetical protein OSCI_3840002 [Kamptonema sp. PCC 6506]|nr:hypothetical protein OSCI_3840002 [Kamptonema sp. PCC 6506]
MKILKTNSLTQGYLNLNGLSNNTGQLESDKLSVPSAYFSLREVVAFRH